MLVRILTPEMIKEKQIDYNSVCVVVDTFRATTSITTLMGVGVKRIYVVANGENAKIIRKKYAHKSLLIGEEGGLRIDGFDYGNNPSLFSDMHFNNTEVIFTSTSGAKTFLLLENVKHVLVGSLVNLSSVAKASASLAKKEQLNVYIIPSSYFYDSNIYVVEDWVTSKLILDKILQHLPLIDCSKGRFYLKTKHLLQTNSDISSTLKNSPNAIKLAEMGFTRDVDYAIQIDQQVFVPKVKKFVKIGKIKVVVIK